MYERISGFALLALIVFAFGFAIFQEKSMNSECISKGGDKVLYNKCYKLIEVK